MTDVTDRLSVVECVALAIINLVFVIGLLRGCL